MGNPNPVPPKRNRSRHSIGRQPSNKKNKSPPPDPEPAATQAAAEAPPAAAAPPANEDEQQFPQECGTMNDALEVALYGDGHKEFLDEKKARRMAIAYLYKTLLSPPEDEWDGQNGIVPKIRRALQIPLRTNIKSTLKDIAEHERLGIRYNGDRIVTGTLGRPPILTVDSPEAQIVADSIEAGLSIFQTTLLCNEHRRQEPLEALTKSPVETLVKKLKPLVTAVKKRKQGSTDENSPWARGRYRWATQILIRTELLPAQKKADETIPDYWNPNKLKRLKKTAISYWDETHKDCTIGGIAAGTVAYQVRFPRDENGKLDLGEYIQYSGHFEQICLI